jgi:AraC-like DNA-binding protein/ligand-binding sensor protein
MSEKNSSCAACLRTQGELARAAMREPATVTCPYGLCETAVPLKLGLETIGFLQTGQVLRRKPTNASFELARRQAAEFGAEIDVEAAREAWFQTPVISRKKLDAATSLLSVFAEHLAMESNQIAVRSANAEPPLVTRAKQFIEEHLAEKLSLGRMAKVLRTNMFYFCKTFKKGSGLNFTEYVSRSRIEKSKNLLLNPNLRVSEIAFEAGFQSLTHFNRVFKEVAGDSPTGYRERLPAGGSQPAASTTASSPPFKEAKLTLSPAPRPAIARPPALASAGNSLAGDARPALVSGVAA